ncbi:YheC/YheD family protein [Alteribacter populi]|uniref:YheC/YheD family protein n=1 Tax=Alteribacter populi TaxID=2011011 RepID=UPI0012FD52A1|nr:YheC/YheD family protein [Alteribacter populi]
MDSTNEEKISIGVFVRRGVIKKFLQQTPIAKYAELHEANEVVKANLFFFSRDGLKGKAGKILGVFFNKRNAKWSMKQFSYPHVVYSRKSGGLAGKKNRQYRREFQIRKVIWWSSHRRYNKWDVFEKLANDPNIKRYLPITNKYKEISQLIPMFKKYSSVYLKSARGTGGGGVIRIRPEPGGGYEWSQHGSELITKKLLTLKELSQEIARFYRKREIIFQEGINLLSMGGRLVDFRGDLQKNGKNQLYYSYINARIGEEGSPIASRTTAERKVLFDEFIEQYMNGDWGNKEKLRRRVHHFLRTTYTTMEKYYGPLGELGIDFGIDHNWKIWLIECNKTPHRKNLKYLYPRDQRISVWVRALEYSKYLYQRQLKSKAVERDKVK